MFRAKVQPETTGSKGRQAPEANKLLGWGQCLLLHVCACMARQVPVPIFRVRVTSRLAVYRQSVRLGAKPLETHDQ
jgi:hypothetical protein